MEYHVRTVEKDFSLKKGKGERDTKINMTREQNSRDIGTSSDNLTTALSEGQKIEGETI